MIRRTKFVLEPLIAVAAAPGDDLDIDGVENVLIFDHGGGTLDLSLIRYERRPGFLFLCWNSRPVAQMKLPANTLISRFPIDSTQIPQSRGLSRNVFQIRR